LKGFSDSVWERPSLVPVVAYEEGLRERDTLSARLRRIKSARQECGQAGYSKLGSLHRRLAAADSEASRTMSF